MKMHFYDLLSAGKSPAEGQVVRFHSALYGDDQELVERVLAIRLRDDVGVSANNIDASPLALLNLGGGISEIDFARATAPLFELPDTLHVGIGTSSKIDPYIRHSIYRSLIPARNVAMNPNSRHLDLDTLYRAIALLRPEDLPEGFSAGGLSGLESSFSASMWDMDWDADNRAARVKELLGMACASSPRLVEHAFSRANIASIKASLGMDDGEVSDLAVVQPALVIHQSILNPAGFSLLFPLATDITYPDIAYMADLECDLTALVDESSKSLESLVRKNKGDGLPIVRVSLSRMPFVAPLKVMRPEDAKRLRVSGDLVRANIQLLRGSFHLAARLRDEPILELNSLPADVDHRMWAGDFSQSDLQVMRELQTHDFPEWLTLASKAHDLRVKELALRVIAREQPSLLSEEQKLAWDQHLTSRMNFAGPSSLAAQLHALQNASSEYPTAQGIKYLLTRLEGVVVRQ